MATIQEVQSFVAKIAPYAQKAYKELGKVKPSVCIGMACVECGYGTARSVKHHSYLGHKVGSGKTATKYWGGRFFTSKTSEEYTKGVHTIIQSAFRAFDSMEQCVFNYYELLNTSLYSKVLASSDYKTQMQQIKACGYMTSSTEVSSVLSIISQYGLTKYDSEGGKNLKIYTIEGNTSSTTGVIPNGGAVAKKSYDVNYSKIEKVWLPKFNSGEADKVIAEAKKWVGYLEKETKAQETSFTANAGDNNYTYFADWLSKNVDAGIYADGNYWCDTFVDFVFVKAVGAARAKQLLGGWSAYTPTSSTYLRNSGATELQPKDALPASIIFFENGTRICHTGIVLEVK